MTLLIFITFIISVALGAITIPNILIISKRKRLFDTVGDRKVHSASIPRLGGVSFMPSIIFSFCFTMGLRSLLGYDIDEIYREEVLTELSLFAAGLIIIFLTGIADDLVGVNYKRKFTIQIAAVGLMILSGVYLKNMHGVFGIEEISPFIGIPLTILIVVGIINAFNLIDGMDGLCSGLAAIALTGLTLWFWYYDMFAYAMLGASTLGILFVFFFFNVSSLRKKLFMGDCGSLILGYTISFLGFKFISISPEITDGEMSCAPLVFLSLVFIPVFDTVRVFAQRIIKHKSPFHPDKTHIHHLFLSLGYTHLQSTGLILICALIIVIINGVISETNPTLLLIIDIIFGIIFLNFIPKIANKTNKRKKR